MAAVLILTALAVLASPNARGLLHDVQRHLRGKHTVADRLAEYGPNARSRWAPSFAHAGIAYPPTDVTLVAIKDQASLVVYARSAGRPWRDVRHMPIVALSGTSGPKLREGDRQVPEGIYAVVSLNADSLYHFALRLDYPNADDRAHARADGRTRLGGDIMIHGSNGSVGCLAMGDEGAEDLFVLAADTGIAHLRVVLVPTDFRRNPAWQRPSRLPPWVDDLYSRLRGDLAALP